MKYGISVYEYSNDKHEELVLKMAEAMSQYIIDNWNQIAEENIIGDEIKVEISL